PDRLGPLARGNARQKLHERVGPARGSGIGLREQLSARSKLAREAVPPVRVRMWVLRRRGNNFRSSQLQRGPQVSPGLSVGCQFQKPCKGVLERPYRASRMTVQTGNMGYRSDREHG